jgi:uncharacterized protein YjlB
MTPEEALEQAGKAVTPQVLHLTTTPGDDELPVLLYKGVLDEKTPDKDKIFQHHFTLNGWRGVWKNGIYDFAHFHPDAHEVLAIASGSVTVQIGGKTGKTLDLSGGDMIVLPAGTIHRRLSGSENLVVVGAYPAGQENYSTLKHTNEDALTGKSSISSDAPSADPMYGAKGPLVFLWS